MKTVAIILFTILLSSIVNAQDVITKRNGDEINATVLEVSNTEIKYKRYDNLDGPTFIMNTSDIFMIKYANGTKDLFNTDNAPAQNDPNANQAAPSNNANTNAPANANRTNDADIAVTAQTAPPPLPVYVQPACPYEGYMWTPGYWAYSLFRGFFWVPGVWVMAPQPGLLWTPGYWGYANGYYGWNEGYWGPHIGYYGGVPYGYGYGGSGYYGGRWEGDAFRYNTAVCNVNTTVVHNTYIDNTVVVSNAGRSANASYNGPGGIVAQPSENERMAMNERHIQPASDQLSHRQTASKDESQYYSVNKGQPATTSMNKINGQSYGRDAQPQKVNTEPARTQNGNSTLQHPANVPVQKMNTNTNENSGTNNQQRSSAPQQKANTIAQKPARQQRNNTKQYKQKPQQLYKAPEQSKNAEEHKTEPK